MLAGDTFAQATLLGNIATTSISVSETIAPETNVDMYGFTVAAGQTVDFNINTPLNGPGGLGSYIRLFNSQGTQLAFNDDAAAPDETLGFDSYLRYTFSAAGTYYLGVSNFNNTFYNPVTGSGDTPGGSHATGAYDLVVQAIVTPASDPDDTFIEANSLGTVSTTSISRSDTISVDVDVDMYVFTVAAGQTVDFNINTPLNGPNGLGSFIRLFNSQSTQLAFNDDAAAAGESLGFDAFLRYKFSTAGTYYLGVSNSNNTVYNPVTGNGDTSGGSFSTGAYQLVVRALPVDPDDTFASANVLGAISATPSSSSASIDPDIDVDLYQFTVTAGQVIDFDIDTPLNGPGGLGSFIRLFNSQGTQLAFNNDAAAPGETLGFDSYLRHTFSTAGTYYLGVSNFDNTFYNPLTGTGDTQGGLHATGTYELVVQAIVAPTSDPDDTLLEANLLGAVSTTSVSRSDTISVDVDVDMYVFTVTAGQTVDFNINTPLNGSNGLGSFIRLFNNQGTQLAFNDNAAAPGESLGFDSFLRFTFTAAGTYYLGVSNFNNTVYNPTTGNGDTTGGSYSTGAYQLVVRALPVDSDDTFANANVLGAISATPSSTSASIDPDIDVDLYQFNVLAGQVVDFNINTPLNGPGGLGSYIRLFNSQGTQLAFNNDAAAPGETLGFDSYLRYTFFAAGTYFLGVSNFDNTFYNPITGSGDTQGGLHATGTYELVVQAIVAPTSDPDDTLLEANLLGAVSTTSVSRSDTISVDVDVDMYVFTVAAGQTVDFNINTPLNGPNGLGSFIRLFNSQGTQLAFNDDAAASGESLGFDSFLRFTFTTTGTYYLGVSNFNNTVYNPVTGNGDTTGGLYSTGSYQLVVRALPVDSDDMFANANVLGAISATPSSTSASIDPDIDVDLYQFTVTAGQVIDFDIDTPLNGPGGLGSYIRLFNSQGTQLAFNNDAAAPGETLGFDSYLRYTFFAAGSYYLGVSNFNNTLYNPVTGTGDNLGGLNATGAYQLNVRLVSNSSFPLHNFANPSDVNDDGSVTALDALAIINYLNRLDTGQPPIQTGPPYADVNADKGVSALDALEVIRQLNRTNSGVGESGLSLSIPLNQSAFVDAVFQDAAMDYFPDVLNKNKKTQLSRIG